MERPGLIIFDLDGVLVDSEPLSAAALIGELAAIGHAVTEEEVRRDFLGRSFPTVAAGLRRRLGPAFPDDFETRYRARLFAAFEAGLAPTPGAAAMLDRLGVPARIATSSTPARAAKALEVTGLAPRFGGRVDTASEVTRGKPEPDLFLLSARRAGVAPDRCLVVEDSAPGILAAAAAGMRSLLFLGGGHHRGRGWDGPAPSTGTIRDWDGLDALLGRDAA
ncbi:MAG: HAD family hydrolase [Hasllibacter sp.]